uniref:Ig-like domain-containing protein n=1 Tax=Cyclopterus lumpus TaxID=8103 RepID=A0A8C2ZMK5_CYCLU
NRLPGVYVFCLSFVVFTDAGVQNDLLPRFTVTVSGLPKPTVQWSHNGKVIKTSSVYKLIEEKEEYTLVITKVTSEYEGDQAEKWVEKMFKVTVPPVFRQKILPLEINIGGQAKFECEIEDAPSVTFKWYKSGIEIKHSEKCRILSRHSSSSLELLNPIKADSNEYTCKASNQHGTDSCTAMLNVTGKTQWDSLFVCLFVKVLLYKWICLRERELYICNVFFPESLWCNVEGMICS